jgi:hypothetical protein
VLVPPLLLLLLWRLGQPERLGGRHGSVRRLFPLRALSLRRLRL